MPRWARFLSCTLTGLLLSLVGFLVAAYWFEGGANFWAQVAAFIATSEFLSLLLLFGLLTSLATLLGRIGVNLYGLADALSGFLAGGLIALVYGAFLFSSQATNWGGILVALPKLWPAASFFTMPFALAGMISTWLWERLD